jgi:hypothetical protein
MSSNRAATRVYLAVYLVERRPQEGCKLPLTQQGEAQ